MERISELLNNPISWLIVWILIAISSHQLEELLSKIGDFLGNPLRSVSTGLEGLATGTKSANDLGKDFIEEMKEIVA